MEYLKKACTSLFRDYAKECVLDISFPIEGVEFDSLKTSRIVFSKEVWSMIQNIALTTQVDEKEIGFLLYGKEFLPNQVYLSKIVLSEAPLKSITAEFGKVITEELHQIIDENLDQRLVVVHGHSHPKISNKYSCFSLGDLSSYVELTESVLDFKEKNVQLVGCLVLPEGTIDFIYYNPEDEKFYKFDIIEVE